MYSKSMTKAKYSEIEVAYEEGRKISKHKTVVSSEIVPKINHNYMRKEAEGPEAIITLIV